MKNVGKTFQNTKGVSVVLEQIFVVLFGVLMLIMVILVFTVLRGKAYSYVSETQFKGVATYVHNGIIIAAENMRISDTGKIFLDLPDKVGDKPYRIMLNSTVINVTDLELVTNASVTVFNVNATLAGNVTSTSGGRVFLIFNKSANTITLSSEERVIS